MIAKDKESRSEVRVVFEYDVRYKIITCEELNLFRKYNDIQDITALKELNICRGLSDNTADLFRIDKNFAEFLLRMDEKLDKIIYLLGENRDNNTILFKGIGKNISASGMNIVVDKPIQRGEVLFAVLALSKKPFICVNVYGEIIRVTRIKENDTEKFHAGVSFVHTDSAVKEKLVSFVFRQQRRDIQKKQN
jgi:hypothetical protein